MSAISSGVLWRAILAVPAPQARLIRHPSVQDLCLNDSVAGKHERDLHGVSALAPKKCTRIGRVNGSSLRV